MCWSNKDMQRGYILIHRRCPDIVYAFLQLLASNQECEQPEWAVKVWANSHEQLSASNQECEEGTLFGWGGVLR